jgi:hypothetical protein
MKRLIFHGIMFFDSYCGINFYNTENQVFAFYTSSPSHIEFNFIPERLSLFF